MSVWDAIDQVRAELDTPSFAYNAGMRSPLGAQHSAARQQARQQYDSHLAYATKTMPHDERSYEDKIGKLDNPGGATGKPCSACSTPEEVAHCIKYGTCVSYQNGSGGSGSGGSGHGGPPSWFKNWRQRFGSRQRGGAGAGAGSGGGRLAGPSALGGFPKLGDVPISQAAPSTGSPIIMIVVVVGLAIGGYLLYHRLKLAKHQDAELSKGKEPTPDAAAA